MPKFAFACALTAALAIAGCHSDPSSSTPATSQASVVRTLPVIKRYAITDAGAIGDGKTSNTKAIQTEIDRCSAEGGGVVSVPAGTFITGSIFLKKGTSLNVEQGGVLKGSVVQADYPQVFTRWEGTEGMHTAALINATDMNDFAISGPGTIDGSGNDWPGRGAPRAVTGPGSAGTRPFARGGRNPTSRPARGQGAGPFTRPTGLATSRQFGGGPGRPRLICLQNCQNARMLNLNLHNQSVWCVHVLYSQDVLLDGLTIKADHNIPSSDGIDIDSCNRVHVINCDIDCNDDCISIKSGKDADGLRVNRPSENILVEKTRFGFGHGGVAMGSETSGGIRHVLVQDCVAEDGNLGPIRFKTQPSRGGVVEDIVYRNFEMRNVRSVFDMSMEWRMVGPPVPPSDPLPVFKDVQIINVHGTANSAGSMHGLPGSPIKNVTFSDVSLEVGRGLTIDNVDTDFKGLTIHAQQGEAIIHRLGGGVVAPDSAAN